MKKIAFAVAICIGTSTFFASNVFAGTCPEGFIPKNEYTYGEIPLCNNAGDKCCIPDPDAGGGQQ